ncbi:mucin-5AC-like [Photinus pyralis]|uniref:mucin-5AC-like n=1 Tax=Photinus pyralis TaxID=7054 RepID=UPI0012674A33|nr:mucin-5AC-like [Photinus pyralis]XP_031339047.1 mucin-5AC-like [Photinus pyralis]XP_031339048.1 mucin-5AC-like [Photinus pyralis]XP_031339049.1 mucin-5AC-like [Photinus pyralis]XP_031339050.1 mucin-5AC-like [Photinus pyralis]XP_031339052.1 mucin-5AC-like [Photinus pyralis]
MQLISIALLIVHAVLVQCVFHIEMRSCSETSSKYIRNQYISEVYSEIEDISDLWKPLLSCAVEVKSTLTLLRANIESAISVNNHQKNQCLNYLVAQSVNIEKKYMGFLNGKCHWTVGGTTKDPIRHIRETTLNLERCTRHPGECTSIIKCCKRVVDDANIKDEVKIVTAQYQRCYRRECKRIKSVIAYMWVGMAIYCKLQNPSVSTGSPIGVTETTPPLNTHPFFISTTIPTTEPLPTDSTTENPSISTETHQTVSTTELTETTPPLNTHPFFISTTIPTTEPLPTDSTTENPSISTETHQTVSTTELTETTPPLNTHPFFISTTIPTTEPLPTDSTTENPSISTETHQTVSTTELTETTPPLNTHPFFISTTIPTTEPLPTDSTTENPSISTETHQTVSTTELTETTPPLNTHPFFISTISFTIPTTKPLPTDSTTENPSVSTETHQTGSTTGLTETTPSLNTHHFFISTISSTIPTTESLPTDSTTESPSVTETHQTEDGITISQTKTSAQGP